MPIDADESLHHPEHEGHEEGTKEA